MAPDRIIRSALVRSSTTLCLCGEKEFPPGSPQAGLSLHRMYTAQPS
jgi:hypothetical protein